MTAITRQISEFAAGISFDKVPTEVIARTGMLLMDSVGIALRARHDAESTPGLVKAAMRLGLDGGTCIAIGDSRAPGGWDAHCNQGTTYRGTDGEICGGYENWGATDVEGWYPR